MGIDKPDDILKAMFGTPTGKSYCQRCKELLEEIIIGHPVGFGGNTVYYCKNNTCDKFGDVTVACIEENKVSNPTEE